MSNSLLHRHGMLVKLAVVVMIELEGYAIGLRETPGIFSKLGLEPLFVGARPPESRLRFRKQLVSA